MELLESLVTDAPSMVAIIVVVVVFVRYLSSRDENAKEDRKAMTEAVQGLQVVMTDNHRTMGQAIEVLSENKTALHRNADVIERNSAVLARVDDHLGRVNATGGGGN